MADGEVVSVRPGVVADGEPVPVGRALVVLLDDFPGEVVGALPWPGLPDVFGALLGALVASDEPGWGILAQYAAIFASPPAALARLRKAIELPVFSLPWWWVQALHNPNAAGPEASGPTGVPVLWVFSLLSSFTALVVELVATGSAWFWWAGPIAPDANTTVATPPSATAAPAADAKVLSPTPDEIMAILRVRGLAKAPPYVVMARW